MRTVAHSPCLLDLLAAGGAVVHCVIDHSNIKLSVPPGLDLDFARLVHLIGAGIGGYCFADTPLHPY
jgi:hypothetical protein